jgi:hypothetical protein
MNKDELGESRVAALSPSARRALAPALRVLASACSAVIDGKQPGQSDGSSSSTGPLAGLAV